MSVKYNFGHNFMTFSSPTQPFLYQEGLLSFYCLQQAFLCIQAINNFRSICSLSLSICSSVSYVTKALYKIKKWIRFISSKRKCLYLKPILSIKDVVLKKTTSVIQDLKTKWLTEQSAKL